MLWCARDGACFAVFGVFGDAVGDVIDCVIAGHVLLLQKVGGIAFAFGEDGDEDVGACHFGAARRLDVDRGALNHALECGCRDGFGAFDISDQIAQVFVDEFHKGFAQLVYIDGAGFHHL